MKIATRNVTGVNGRLPVLLRWLSEAAPHIVCLQEVRSSIQWSRGSRGASEGWPDVRVRQAVWARAAQRS
jgi:exodeoxyribonuclease-3